MLFGFLCPVTINRAKRCLLRYLWNTRTQTQVHNNNVRLDSWVLLTASKALNVHLCTLLLLWIGIKYLWLICREFQNYLICILLLSSLWYTKISEKKYSNVPTKEFIIYFSLSGVHIIFIYNSNIVICF